ncbi:MAG: hypothetical protein MN733_02420 [Nitrososphaera sp.]|nr:hypothetical protein [Nitrososphaera sp.]
MSRTITVEGDVNAVDTRVTLTTQGSVAAPSLVVPSGMTKIIGIIAAAAIDGLADDGGAIFFMRLGGAAVLGGEQVLVFAGAGSQTVQSGSDAAPSIGMPYVMKDVDIEVSPSDTIAISAEMAGVDPGDSAVAITLIYGK